uniref:Uncharacterized protein n=1 Tax=Opuntia streptacantha TaxID=393608 RepID=A0A7C9DBQ4_OPUST
MASSFISSSPFTQYHPSSFQIPTSTVTMPYFTITTTFSNFPAAVTGGLTSTCHRIPAMVSTDHCLMCSIGACTTQRSHLQASYSNVGRSQSTELKSMKSMGCLTSFRAVGSQP